MVKFILFLAISLPSFLISQTMRVAVFSGDKIQRINFSYSESSYSIYADTNYVGDINVNDFVDIVASDSSKVKLYFGVLEVGSYNKIKLIQNASFGNLTLTQKNTEVKPRKYVGDFEVSNNKNSLQIVNCVYLEDYISGVVESEGGVGHHLEYYKAQAVLSRTYAMRNLNRHGKDGYDLCDRTHCQAYFNKWRFSNNILKAVQETKQDVLIDSNYHYVEGFFHANCGGQTSEADLIWNESIPYLKTFRDTFCIYTKQAKWEKKIPKSKWTSFFQKNYFISESDAVFNYQQFNFQQECRKAFFVDPRYGIPLREIRDEFKLKSTFFSCQDEGEYVKLIGKGFGHGVGLCQEGAMKMAKLNYTYKQILSYYFSGTEIVKLETIMANSNTGFKLAPAITYKTFFENLKSD
jgi:stage II sporulation protein D